MPNPRVSSSLARGCGVSHRLRSIDERLGKLEAAPPPSRGVLARFFGGLAPALPQLFSSVVIVILGFAIKDSVDIAIRQQQLQQSFAAGAHGGLEQMTREGAGPEVTKQAAAVVAAFGSAAVMPLVNELRAGGNRTVGAEAGLGALTLTEPEAVCNALRRALAHSGQWLHAEAYMATVRTLTLADCTDALDVLRDHLARLSMAPTATAEPAKSLMEPRPTPQQLKSAIEEVSKAIKLLEALPERGWSRWFHRGRPV
jgi:hypothetical protein